VLSIQPMALRIVGGTYGSLKPEPMGGKDVGEGVA
jgi:hypothetical protein